MTLEQHRAFALSLPGVGEGDSCVNRKFFAGKKNFLFLGEKPDSWSIRLRLPPERFDEADPYDCRPGSIGWLKLELSSGEEAPAIVKEWVVESYTLLAPKKLVKQLQG